MAAGLSGHDWEWGPSWRAAFRAKKAPGPDIRWPRSWVSWRVLWRLAPLLAGVTQPPVAKWPFGYATLVVLSDAGSGAGPQIYAEKMGRSSVLSPREIMIPIGSSISGISRAFFIVVSGCSGPRSCGYQSAMSSRSAKLAASPKLLGIRCLRIDGYFVRPLSVAF
jgi:hypothetical protein